MMKPGGFSVRRDRVGPVCKRFVIGCMSTSPLVIISLTRRRAHSEVYRDGKGVCRDFMHLAVTFCRCLNIPARYVTGYLGDIGVPPAPYPMDFSAWFEVFLGDKWHTFDARHNQRRIGRILMAVGRDAADVALTTNFGSAKLLKFEVVTEEVK